MTKTQKFNEQKENASLLQQLKQIIAYIKAK